MRQFTDADIQNDRISTLTTELLYDPPAWMRAGLQETASGDGNRLNSGYKIHFNGRLYRVYTTIHSNNGVSWFVSKRRKIFVG